MVSGRPNYERVPLESIVVFVFIGVVFFVGLIARCLAMNHSTTGSANSADLMIYQAAPRPVPVPKARRSSIESSLDSNTENRELKPPQNELATPARIQRGPKNLWSLVFFRWCFSEIEIRLFFLCTFGEQSVLVHNSNSVALFSSFLDLLLFTRKKIQTKSIENILGNTFLIIKDLFTVDLEMKHDKETLSRLVSA